MDRPQSLSERAEAVVVAVAGLDRGILVQPEEAGVSLHFSGFLSSCVNNASPVPCVVDKQKKKKKGRKKKK